MAEVGGLCRGTLSAALSSRLYLRLRKAVARFPLFYSQVYGVASVVGGDFNRFAMTCMMYTLLNIFVCERQPLCDIVGDVNRLP